MAIPILKAHQNISKDVRAGYASLTDLNNVFNSTAETVTSAEFDCSQYRVATFSGELTKANTPTDIRFDIETSSDGTNFQKYRNNGLGDIRESNASIGTSGKPFSFTFPIACARIRIKATSSGTDASNTITLANAGLYLRS